MAPISGQESQNQSLDASPKGRLVLAPVRDRHHDEYWGRGVSAGAPPPAPMFEHMTFGDTGVESRDGNMSGSDSANLLHIREATVIMTNSPAGEYTLVRSR
nr:hypothetical protein GCM10017611_47040 [Rhodococcus wratislaviensis]